MSVLVTGAFGCIGQATVAHLLEHSDERVVLFSRKADVEGAARTFGRSGDSRLIVERGNVTDQQKLFAVLNDHAVTRVVHLAGLQTPDCNQHRDLGLQVNLAGTQKLIEAIKQLPDLQQVQSFVYASSGAVYGARSTYSERKISPQSRIDPVNVYGIWKFASELVAKMFCHDTQIPTTSIRFAVLFGPGRDLGMTAAPTTAMKCVALNVPFTIPFNSTLDYQYAPDVGAAVSACALRPRTGYHVFNLPSVTRTMAEVIDAIRLGADSLGISERFQIQSDKQATPFSYDFDFQSFLDLYPDIRQTPFDQAVRESIAEFLRLVEAGQLDAGELVP